MRFHITVSTATGALLAAVSFVSAQSLCSTSFTGTAAELQAAQQASLKDFGDLFLVKKDIRLAFERYVPNEYINHNPGAQSGRQNALDSLIPALANPQLTFTNIQSFSGQGYGFLHYRSKVGTTSTAVMDKFRFSGTCIVEHWDVNQGISGRESNPIAFF